MSNLVPKEVLQDLHRANQRTGAHWPGEPARRQPVHVVYGGAHLFRADTAVRLGELARAAFETHAPDAATLSRALGIPAELGPRVYERVAEKLRQEPVEDFRIDFEDGYGTRPD